MGEDLRVRIFILGWRPVILVMIDGYLSQREHGDWARFAKAAFGARRRYERKRTGGRIVAIGPVWRKGQGSNGNRGKLR